MKVVFFGTSEFAATILKSIKEKTDWEIGLVVCEPAKPAGRSKNPVDSPVALYTKENNLNLLTPVSAKDIQEDIKKIEPDVGIVVAYGQIIPRSVFDIPKFKTINIHPSLLPKLRGPSPIQEALLKGLKETGVSLMIIDEKMDHGPVLSQETFEISDADNYNTLEIKLADLGSKMLIRDLPKYISGQIKPIVQNESEATYTHLIKKEDGHINLQKTSDEIYNQWRAFLKWPGLFTFFKNRNGQSVRLKLIDIEKADVSNKSIGEVFTIGKELFVSCDSGEIKIKKLQPENSKIQTAAEFLNGYGYIVGQKLF
jgi:methionyl-tRNA formyltransferase